MSIKSVLTDVKARLDGLLSFANETTGAGDVSLGDAVLTLANGYGGGGSDHLTFVREYIVPESWENDTQGNPVAIFNAVFGDITQEDGFVYFIVMIGNNASQINYRGDLIYKANKVWLSSDRATMNISGAWRNNFTIYRAFNTDSSIWVSQGTVLRAYTLDVRLDNL